MARKHGKWCVGDQTACAVARIMVAAAFCTARHGRTEQLVGCMQTWGDGRVSVVEHLSSQRDVSKREVLGASGAEPRRGIRSEAKLRFRGGGEGAELRGIVVVVTGLISAGECQRWQTCPELLSKPP